MKNDRIDSEKNPTVIRRSETEFRRHVLDAAKDMIIQLGGLKVSLDEVSFEQVIKQAGISRSTAYRYWPQKEIFYSDLLRELTGSNLQGTPVFDPETIQVVARVIAENIAQLDTAQGRRNVLRQVIRQGAERNFSAIISSTQWRNYIALTATLLSLSIDSVLYAQLRESLKNSETNLVDNMSRFYEDMAVVLGLRLRYPDKGYRVIAITGAAIMEGFALRQIITPEFHNEKFNADYPFGPEQWTAQSLVFLAMIEGFMEPVDNYDPAIALKEYLIRTSNRSGPSS